MRTPACLAAGAAVVALVAVATCAHDPVAPDGPLSGAWGGVGISLLALPDGSRVELDCAHGTGDPLVVEGGRFEVDGTWYREGGPVPEEGRPGVPAVFSGSVAGGRMRVSIRVGDREEPLGPFLVVRDRQAVLRKCL